MSRVDNWDLSVLTHFHQETFLVLLTSGSTLGSHQGVQVTGTKHKLKHKYWSEAELTKYRLDLHADLITFVRRTFSSEPLNQLCD